MPGSDWLRDELTKYIFTTEAMGTRPAAWYVALFKADGTEVDGTDDANYSRQSVAFSTYATGRARNDAVVSFPAAEAGADYEVTHWGVYTDASAGEELIKQELEFSRQVSDEDVISFAPNDLIVGIGG